MTDNATRADPPDEATNGIAPLPGEAGIPNVAEPQRISISKKGLLAVGLLMVSLVVVAAFTIQRLSASGHKAEDAQSRLAGNRPAAATAEPRRLDVPLPPAAASAPVAASPRIPAIVPTAEELASRSVSGARVPVRPLEGTPRCLRRRMPPSCW